MNQFTHTAKDIDTHLKASSKFKKIFTYSGHQNPVIPVTASTYKTGKHGHAKTRMLLRDFFTDNTFSDILDSDEKFIELEAHPSYKVELAVISEVSKSHITVINESYETIDIPEKNPEVFKLCEGAEYLTYIKFFNGTDTIYKIKTVNDIIIT